MVKIVQGDVTDAPSLFRTIRENNVEKIIHTASLLGTESNTNPLMALKVNCEGTICVFEAARVLGLEKVVWSSSHAAFGPPEMYPDEYIPNDAPHYQKWLRKSEQGDKWNRCLIEGMIVLSETGARDEQTTPP